MESSSLLAILIFITITRNLVCNAQINNIKCSSNDREALLEFKNGLNDPENRLSSWAGLDCCQWEGVLCDNITGGVTEIDLHNPYGSVSTDYNRYGKFLNLSGEINPSLMKLRSLIHLDLSFNTFGEIPIPEFLGSLRNLEYLNLSNAGFTGKMPSTIGNLSNLQYFDISSSFSSLVIDDFEWISGLVSLKHLGMNNVDFSLVNPNWLEMLNMLPQLKELHLSNCGLSGSISSIRYPNFTSLSVIDLSFNSFNSIFPDWIVNITSLVYIDLSNCMLRGRIPLNIGELPNLRSLKLGLNGNLSASAFSLFRKSWKSIEFLDLASNNIHGKLPSSIGNMTTLIDFNLFNNNLEGGIPTTIGSLCNLVHFDLSGNEMNGTLPDLLVGMENCGKDSYYPLPSLMTLRLSGNKMNGGFPDWLGEVKNLEELSMSDNLLQGPLPDSLGYLRNLTDLSLAGNRLNGSLPKSIGELSEVTILDVSFNYMNGILTEEHFSKMSKLKILRVSSNSFILNVSSTWLPPFQIRNLDMGSCRLGTSFPEWIKSQKNEIMFLDISNASISSSIPTWFWDLSSNLSLINISFNSIHGPLPNLFRVTPFADIDFSNNLFEGSIPLPSVEIELFDLSNNRFQGSIPRNISNVMPNLIFLSLSGNRLIGEIPDSIGSMVLLQVIDLSRNNLTGKIPSSIGNCTYLKALDLGENNLSAEIPDSLGYLTQLQSLHLNENMFSGKIPFSFKNLSSLETLDLGRNMFEGELPLWLGEEGNFTSLKILNLRSNAFSGEISLDFSNLGSLQVLDLAENNFTGRIPTSWRNLRSMAKEQTTNEYLFYGRYRGLYYEENLVLNVKNQFQKFTKTLSLVTAIDLSENNLFGEFPEELTELNGLIVLNLSRNHISGKIPESISRLRQLGSLDLSSNDLSGAIPYTMASLSFLGYLNLSSNNLSGEIPDEGHMSTFGTSSFEGNPGLCGAPLLVACPGEEDSRKRDSSYNDSSDGLIDRWFYLSTGLGYAAGILVPLVVLSMRKSWRDKYFDLIEKIVAKLRLVRQRS